MSKTEKQELREIVLRVKTSLTYLDKTFKKQMSEDNWEEWRVIKQYLAVTTKNLQDDLPEMPKKMMEVVIWSSFEDACQEGTDFCKLFQEAIDDWMGGWDDCTIPILLETLMVSFDVSRGFSVTEAKTNHKSWLDEDVDNRTYGDYFYTPEGQVIDLTSAIEA